MNSIPVSMAMLDPLVAVGHEMRTIDADDVDRLVEGVGVPVPDLADPVDSRARAAGTAVEIARAPTVPTMSATQIVSVPSMTGAEVEAPSHLLEGQQVAAVADSEKPRHGRRTP